MAYIGSSPTKVVSRQSANIFTYTATANQTAFTGSDANGNTLACTPSDIMVHMNGLKLEESDYTASTTTVTLGSGAAAGDEVTITAFVTFESADHYNKSTADTRYVNTTGDTMTGVLTANNDIIANKHLRLYTTDDQANQWYVYNNTDDSLRFNYNGAGNDEVILDTTGRMRVPNTPAFHAKGLANSASAGGTANGNEVLLFNGITYNNGSHYNASNGRFTAPCAGIYYFSYSLLYDNSFNNAGSAMLRKNASGAGEYGYVEGSNVDYMQVSASAVVSCSTGDYVDVYSYPAGWHIASETSFTGFMIG